MTLTTTLVLLAQFALLAGPAAARSLQQAQVRDAVNCRAAPRAWQRAVQTPPLASVPRARASLPLALHLFLPLRDRMLGIAS